MIVDEITEQQILSIESNLNQKGFEILKEKNSILIQKIKNIIINHVESHPESKQKFSEFLSKKIGYDYSYISLYKSNHIRFSWKEIRKIFVLIQDETQHDL